jgi:hypothetical protein
MLLAKESQLGCHLVRAFCRVGQPSLEIRVLLFDRRQSLMREQIGRTVGGLERLETRLCCERATTEPGELFAEAPYELFQFVERRELRRCAV